MACTVTLGPGSVTYDASVLSPGDTICLAAGDYTELRINYPHGTAANPITVINSGGQVRVLDDTFHMRNPEHVIWRGNGAAGTTYGFYTEVRFRVWDDPLDVDLSYFEVNAGQIRVNNDQTTSHEMTDIDVHHCYVYNSGTALTPFYLGHARYDLNPGDYVAKRISCRDNIIENTQGRCIKVASCVEDAKIYNNTLTNVNQSADTVAMAMSPGTSGEVYNNVVNGCGDRAFHWNDSFFTKHWVYNNLFIDCGANATDPDVLLSYYDYLKAYNNTIIGATRYGINLVSGTTDNCELFNNIVLDTDSSSINDAGGGADIHDNHTKEGGHTKQNYYFVDWADDDYHLTEDSPGVDAGTDTDAPSSDLDGVSRPQGNATDIGAYEYSVAVSESIPATVSRTAATVAAAPYTQDFTTTDLEGTPGTAMYIITRATADGTATDHACFGVGVATAADEEWAAAFTDEHGQGTMDSASRNINDGCILILDPGDTAEDGEASHNSFISNGSRVTWTNAPADAYLVTTYHFGGDNLSAQAGTVSLGDAVDNAVVVNTLDFEPDVVIAVLQDGLTGSGSGSGVNFSMGVVHNGTTVTQRSYCLVSQDNQATSALAARFTEDYGVMAITTVGALDYGVEFGSFTPLGFTVTTRNAGGNSSDLLFLALSFGGTVDSAVMTINTPIATGNDTQPPPDFVPIFVMQLISHCEAVDMPYIDGAAGAWCLSAFDEDDEYSNSIAIEVAAHTSNTQCLSDNQAVNMDQHDGTDGHEAAFVAFSSWTLDWTKTLATAKVGWAFALGSGTPTAEETGAAAVVVSSAVVVSDLRRHELYLTNDQGLRLADGEGRNPLTTFLWLRASRVVNGIGWIDVGVPLSFDTALFLKEDFMIQFWRAPRGGALSLWRPYFLRRWRFESFSGVDSVILSGPDVNDLLRRRWVIAYAGTSWASKSDYADDMMKEIVTENTQAGADLLQPLPTAGTREWDLLSVAGDLSAGPIISKGLSFKGPLLSPSGGGVLPEIARASRVAGTDLFFDVVTSSVSAGSIGFEFRTYTGQRGQDLSDILVFDEARGNMGNAYYEYDASQEITYGYGAGKGDGAARNIQQVYDSDRYGISVWNRCEAVADARNEDSDNAVREKARDLLQSGEPVKRAGGTLKDTRETRCGVHWNFGDKVRARYKGYEFISMINSIVLSVNKAGEQVVARWDYNSDV